MKKSSLLLVLVIFLTISINIGCPSKNISTIEDVEGLFQENDYQYNIKIVEEEYQLDYALEQRVYEIEGMGGVYVYSFSDYSDLKKGELELGNELLRESWIATTEKFVFAYKNVPPTVSPKLHVVIDEIKKSESKEAE